MPLMTEQDPQLDAVYGADVFRSTERERDEILREVPGALPAELRGKLYRNGPARWARERATHAFDGDGMITQLIFDGTSVRYRNRFVRTPSFQAGGRRGIGTQNAAVCWPTRCASPPNAPTPMRSHGDPCVRQFLVGESVGPLGTD